MAAIFERIRTAVLQEATRPSPYDAKQHDRNRDMFKSALQKLCSNAYLRADMTADELWGHVWTKIRYAGFKAAYVSLEIPRLTPFFNDFRALIGPEWRFDSIGNVHGEAVREFLGKAGRFAGISYNKSARKLRKILTAAAAFQRIPPGAQALAVLFGDDYGEPGDEALWRAHERLAELVGYTTALHVMMDIGFNCVKPDIWLVRLMCLLGWIEDALAATSTEDQIRKTYQTPSVAKAVITRARQIAGAMHAWHSDAPLREFDLVMVKYGQRPGEFGIVRSLHEHWLPVQDIMKWRPSE
jgi:hypothetical protein